MKNLRKVLWLTFSETDHRFLDLFRVGYAIGLATFLTLSIASSIRGEVWDPVAFGTGLGGLLVLGGAGVGLRGRLEDGKTNELEINQAEEVQEDAPEGR